MPAVPQRQSGGLVGSRIWDTVKMGAMTGGLIGSTTGFLHGAFTVMRFGHGGMGAMPYIARSMLMGGGSFGVFLAIGSLIRSH